MKQLGVVLAGSIVLWGCTQNPMPKTGSIQGSPAPEPRAVVPPFVLDVPNTLDFVEGEEATVKVRAEVPAPGTPEVSAFDLPEGATFDPATLTLNWTPGYQAANDPKNPMVITRSYPVRFLLRSSADNLTTVEHFITLIVRDTARTHKVEYVPEKPEFTEGVPGSFVIRMVSQDYPEGPFTIRGENLPPGAVIAGVPGKPNEFSVKYNPPPSAVTIRDLASPAGYYKNLKVGYTVFSPLGKQQIETHDWKILDKRQTPKGTGPATLSQGLDINFTYFAEDLNGEYAPNISIDPVPDFGTLKFSPVELSAGDAVRTNPVAGVAVRWNNIPVEKLGTSATLKVKACVYRITAARDLCVSYPLTVNFSGDALTAPTIDRRNYPLGVVKYVRVNETIRVPLQVSSATGNVAKVVLEPESLKEEIAWSGNQLTITPKTAGFKQFNLVAISSLGAKLTESFVFEALPWSWSPVLVLGENARNPEVASALELFEGAQLANPELQELEGRTSALRTTLVMTTSSLLMTDSFSAVEKLVGSIKNLVILSPRLDRFDALKTEMATLRVESIGHLSIQPAPVPVLADLVLDPKGLFASTKPIRLGGKLTGDSADPLLFKLANGRCKEILGLTTSVEPVTKYPLAVACSRINGGVMVLSGAEWGDFATDAADVKIAKKWMGEVVKP